MTGTLALGFGAAIAVFGIVDFMLRRPLAVREQDPLVLIDKFTPRADPFPFPSPDVARHPIGPSHRSHC